MVIANFLADKRTVPAYLKHAPDIGFTVIDIVAPPLRRRDRADQGADHGHGFFDHHERILRRVGVRPKRLEVMQESGSLFAEKARAEGRSRIGG